MKKLKTWLVLSIAVFLQSICWGGAGAITAQDLAGSFIVAKMAIPGPYYVVELVVAGDGKNVTFRDANMDYLRPADDCQGTLTISDAVAQVTVACKSAEGFTFNIDIGLENLTLEKLEVGQEVLVKSDFTEGQWLPFFLRKQATTFFPVE